MRELDSDCREVFRVPGLPRCGMPLEELGRFTLGGTAVVEMRRVRCPRGHIYDEVVSVIEEPA